MLAAGGAVAASQTAAELILTLCQMLRPRLQFELVFFSSVFSGLMQSQHVISSRPQTCNDIKYFQKVNLLQQLCVLGVHSIALLFNVKRVLVGTNCRGAQTCVIVFVK